MPHNLPQRPDLSDFWGDLLSVVALMLALVVVMVLLSRPDIWS